MLNEDDLRPGDVIQDAMGDFWHVHDDGKIWCSTPEFRISFDTADGSCGPFTYPQGGDPKRDAANDSEDDSVENEGKWTRDDLPEPSRLSRLKHEIVKDFFWEDILDEIADHLNAHYPKTAHRLLSSAAECVLGAEDRVRSAKAERDAAIARAEQLEKKLAKAMSDYQDVEDERDEWKARAEAAEARTVITREDVTQAVRRGHNMLNAEVGVVNEMCDLLGIETEPTVDLIEEKAIELHRVAYGGRIGFGHATLNAQEMFRSLARHVLGQEAGDE